MINSAIHPRLAARVRRTFTMLLSCIAALAPATAQAWSSTLNIGIESHDNVTESIREEKSDIALTAALDVSTLHIINRDWLISYGGSLQTSAW